MGTLVNSPRASQPAERGPPSVSTTVTTLLGPRSSGCGSTLASNDGCGGAGRGREAGG